MDPGSGIRMGMGALGAGSGNGKGFTGVMISRVGPRSWIANYDRDSIRTEPGSGIHAMPCGCPLWSHWHGMRGGSFLVASTRKRPRSFRGATIECAVLIVSSNGRNPNLRLVHAAVSAISEPNAAQSRIQDGRGRVMGVATFPYRSAAVKGGICITS